MSAVCGLGRRQPQGFDRLCKMGVEESGAGDWSGGRESAKILGSSEDAPEQKASA